MREGVCGRRPQPRRQPVIQKVLEKPSTTIVLHGAEGRGPRGAEGGRGGHSVQRTLEKRWIRSFFSSGSKAPQQERGGWWGSLRGSLDKGRGGVGALALAPLPHLRVVQCGGHVDVVVAEL